MNTQVLHEVSPGDLPQRVRNRLAQDQDEEYEGGVGLKVEINNFCWMHLPADTTLREAERIACTIFATMKDVGVEVKVRN